MAKSTLNNFRTLQELPSFQSVDFYPKTLNQSITLSLFRFIEELVGSQGLQLWAATRTIQGKPISLSLGLGEWAGILEVLDRDYGKGFGLQLQSLEACPNLEIFNEQLGYLIFEWRDLRQTRLLFHVQAWTASEKGIRDDVKAAVASSLVELGGKSPWPLNYGEIAEGNLRRFLPGIFEGGLCAGMLAGGVVGLAGKAHVLNALWKAPASVMSRGLGAELASGGVGLVLESAGAMLGSRLYRGSLGEGGIKAEYQNLILSLGFMKVGGVYFEGFRLGILGRFLGYALGIAVGESKPSEDEAWALSWWMQRGIEFFQLELGGRLAQRIAPGMEAWQRGLQLGLARGSHQVLWQDFSSRFSSGTHALSYAPAGFGKWQGHELNLLSESVKPNIAKSARADWSESVRLLLQELRVRILAVPVHGRTLAKSKEIVERSDLTAEVKVRLLNLLKMRPCAYFIEALNLVLVRNHVYRDEQERKEFLATQGQGWLRPLSGTKTFLGKNAVRIMANEMVSRGVMSLGEAAVAIGSGKSALAATLLNPESRRLQFIEMISVAILALPIGQGGYGIKIHHLSKALGPPDNTLHYWVKMFKKEWPEAQQWENDLKPWRDAYEAKIAKILKQLSAIQQDQSSIRGSRTKHEYPSPKNTIAKPDLKNVAAAIQEFRSLEAQGVQDALARVAARYRVHPEILEFWIENYESNNALIGDK